MKLSTVYDHFDASIAGEVRERTRQWYKTQLTPMIEFLGNPEVDSITAHDLRRWRIHLLNKKEREYGGRRPTKPGKLSIATVRGYVRALRRFFRWAYEERDIPLEHNPSSRINLPPRDKIPPKAISAGDLLMLLKEAESNPRDLAIVAFLADTGCRVSGLVALNKSDLYLDEYKAEVREKGGKTRWVYFSQGVYVALVKYLAEHPRPDDPAVFVGPQGRLTSSGIYQVLMRLAKRAGVQGRFNPHSFRHAFAREALQNGGNLGVVSELLGHESVEVTARYYARWQDSELHDWHNRISPLSKSNLADNIVDDESRADDKESSAVKISRENGTIYGQI